MPVDPRPRPVWGFAFVAAVPGLGAAARAAVGGWLPAGDDAIHSARAFDVGTANNPLLATWSSLSRQTGIELNHPGPLIYELLAPFRRIGGPIGIRVGTGVLVALACATAVVLAADLGSASGRPHDSSALRRSRATAFAGAAALTALIAAAAFGPRILTDPWNHHSPLLVFFAALVASAACLAGVRWAGPALIVTTAFCAQTSLAYGGLAMCLAAIGLVGLIADAHERAREDGTTPSHPWIRSLTVPGVVALAVWWAPLYEQFVAPEGRPGNLEAIVRSTAADGTHLGWSRSPGWLAAAFFPRSILFPTRYRLYGWDPMRPLGALTTIAIFAVLIAAIVVTAVALRRTGHRRLARVVHSLWPLLVVALWTLSGVPTGAGPSPPYTLWLLPFAAYTCLVLALGLGTVVTALRPPRPSAIRLASALGAATALTLAAVAPALDPLPDSTSPWAYPVIDTLSERLAADIRSTPRVGSEPLLVASENNLTSYAVLPSLVDALIADGVHVRFAEAPLRAQYGPRRWATGDEKWILTSASGAAAADPPSDAIILRTYPSHPAQAATTFSRDESRLLDELRRIATARSMTETLSHTLLPAHETLITPKVARDAATAFDRDPAGALRGGQVDTLIRARVLRLSTAQRRLVDRWRASRDRAEQSIVIYLIGRHSETGRRVLDRLREDSVPPPGPPPGPPPEPTTAPNHPARTPGPSTT